MSTGLKIGDIVLWDTTIYKILDIDERRPMGQILWKWWDPYSRDYVTIWCNKLSVINEALVLGDIKIIGDTFRPIKPLKKFNLVC